jgi:hypothetical protein
MIFTASASTTSTSPGDLAVPVSVTGGGQPNTWSLPGFLERRAFAGITAWLNTPAADRSRSARSAARVVLSGFRTYSCINCQRTLLPRQG